MKYFGIAVSGLCFFLSMTTLSLAWASSPVVIVSSPASNSTDPTSVHYVATAASPQCARGIASIRIYTAPHISPVTVEANHLDTTITLAPGFYNTVVQAFDMCGGVGKAQINITVMSAQLPPPRFLYMAQFSTGKIAGFLVNPATGGLTSNGQAAVSAHAGPVHIASDHGGFRLYVVNQGSRDLNAYFINRANGHLSAVPGSPFPLAGSGTNLAVHPSGRFVYVSTGTAGGGKEGITVLTLRSDGSLKTVPGSPFAAGFDPLSLAIDPAGRFLYVGHDEGNFSGTSGFDIDAFRIDKEDGTLIPVAGEPYTIPIPDQCFLCDSGAIPDLTTDVSGNFLLAPVLYSGLLASYRINPNGSLVPAPGSPFILGLPNSPTAPGALPSSLAVDAQNRYVFVTTANCDGAGDCFPTLLNTLELNSSTGFIAGSLPYFDTAGTCNQNSLRTDPSGRFVYGSAATGCPQFAESATGTGVVLGLSLDRSNGALTLLPGSPFPVKSDLVNVPADTIVVVP